VSTDCPSGPAEILAGGAYGRLVPVGDAAALADALAATLDEPPARERLVARARSFSVERAVAGYEAVLAGLALPDPVAPEPIAPTMSASDSLQVRAR
jgi:glycosyltransferase involved in cell wall biosynthesis